MKTDHTSYERYQRQIILKEFGEAGQEKLLQSKVLVIGAGGLGCPALQYLAAAGTGTLGIVDDDVVSLSNLHRQVLYTTNDIGFPKAEKAKQILHQLNPEIDIVAYNQRLTTKNAFGIINSYDIIIDCTDNFSSRYMINDACVLLNKPFVFGAVSQFEGQVTIFNYQHANGAGSCNYRDLFPQPPKEGEVLNCAEAGVLGVLPGIIGAMQANETIKLITGIGKPFIDILFNYNALSNSVYEFALAPREETRLLIPPDEEAFNQMDYDWLCNFGNPQFEIDAAAFNELLATGGVEVIDVREPDELPLVTAFRSTRIPLLQLKENLTMISGDTVAFFCQSGKRSLVAAQWLFDKFGKTKKIFSLQGGIVNWIKSNQTQQL